MPPKKTNLFKRWVLLWVWRLQQPGQIFGLVMNAINMTLLANLYIKWRFNNPYVGVLLSFGAVMFVVSLTAWIWDKSKMWHEQIAVSVQKNPYQAHTMTPKEIVGYKMQWIPFNRKVGLNDEADFWEEWCDEQMALDPELKKDVEEILEWRKANHSQ